MDANYLLNFHKQRRALSETFTALRRDSDVLNNATGSALAVYPAPAVLEAPENVLNPGLGATVSVDYEYMDYDGLVVHWTGEGNNLWESDVYEVLGEGPFEFSVPREIVLASANSIVAVSYIVIRAGTPSISRSLSLKVGDLEVGDCKVLDYDFQDLTPGPVPSPLRLQGVTIAGNNMEVMGTGGQSLYMGQPCTITFDKEVTFCSYQVVIIGSPFEVHAYAVDGQFIELARSNNDFGRAWVGRSAQNKIKRLDIKGSALIRRLIFA